MKKQYMEEFELPEEFSKEFIGLIPAQKEKVSQYFNKGFLKSYALANDRSVLWAVFLAESEFEILELIADFPLAKYMTPFISELMFHNNDSHVMHFSLN